MWLFDECINKCTNGHEVKEKGGKWQECERENKSKVGRGQGNEKWLIFSIYDLNFREKMRYGKVQ